MPRRIVCVFAAVVVVAGAVACGGSGETDRISPTSQADGPAGEIVTPPFRVEGDAAGLILTWFDERGTHVASARHEIPEARRAEVRVDSLEIPPDERDPDHVFVADLRAPGEDGRYVVRRMRREDFDRRVEAFGRTDPGAGPGTADAESTDVVIFGASWCSACREAAAFLRSRGIAFVERDVERDPGAREDMQRRAARAGITPTGIPIIDFRGRIIQGFDREALERAIRETAGGNGGITI